MWQYCGLFPNIEVQTPFETKDFQIVSRHDDRIAESIGKPDNPLSFIAKFTNYQKEEILPAILLFKKRNKSHRPNEKNIYEIRNIISLCSQCGAWIHALVDGQENGTLNSDYFLLYPVGLNKNYSNLVMVSWFGKDPLTQYSFIGQPDPRIVIQRDLDPNIFDRVLFNILDDLRRHKRSNRALFRSIEVAFFAGIAPFETRASIHSIGTRIIMWVSAFEILANSRFEDGSIETVWKLLEIPKGITKAIHKKKYKRKYKKIIRWVNLAQRLYHRMFILRNSFAHGNRVKVRDIYFRPRNVLTLMTNIAPLLFAIALYNYTGNINKLPKDYENALKSF